MNRIDELETLRDGWRDRFGLLPEPAANLVRVSELKLLAAARRIHYGEAEERSIHGRASAEEARALVEEGIEVAALPLPDEGH